MARIFISYGHLKPDQAVAHELASALDSSGHEVFIDTQIPLGSTWGDLIEERLADVDCLIALVSASSSTNPMVVTEIETAHHLNRINGRPLIIPVRVGDDFHLRYPLSAYVSRFQHGVWRGKAIPLR